MACANAVSGPLRYFPFSDEEAEIQVGYVPCLTGGEILGCRISFSAAVHLGAVWTQFHFSLTRYPRAIPAPHTYHSPHDEESARWAPGASGREGPGGWGGLPVAKGTTTTP